MIALLDLGNSRYKLAPLPGEIPGDVRAGEYGSTPLESIVRVVSRAVPDHVYISSVRGPEFNCDLHSALTRTTRAGVTFFETPASGFGVRIAYPEPSRLGVDRFLAMVAARRILGTAAIVIDCGTAITIDAMDLDGRHLGGIILPGLRMMRRSLTAGAAEVNVLEEVDSHELFAKDTVPGVLSGTTRAVVASLEVVSRDMQEHIPTPASVVITGGDAEYLARHLPESYIRMPHLVLRGLAITAKGE